MISNFYFFSLNCFQSPRYPVVSPRTLSNLQGVQMDGVRNGTNCCSPVDVNQGTFQLMDDDEFQQYLDMTKDLNFLSYESS